MIPWRSVLLAAAVLCVPTLGHAQSAKVLTGGCASINVTGLDTYPQTMDSTGQLCTSGTSSSGTTASTPAAATASAIVTGGAATTLVTGPVNGCWITNPITATDQNIATAEVAYVNAVTTATANGRGTNVRLDPGQTFRCVPGQTTNVSAIAATTSHAFSVSKW